MNRKKALYLILFVIILSQNLISSALAGDKQPVNQQHPDPLKENQILYNGRIWQNHFTNVKGNQFLFSNEYLPATVTINGKYFKGLNINFDIYNDEIITPKNNGAMVQLNKEMVDSFTLQYELKTYRFKNTDPDSLKEIKGYVNVLYEGKCALYVKYKKEIELLAVDDKYDLFFQTQKIFLVQGKTVTQISNKKDLLKAMNNEKVQIKAFMKKNGVRVSKKTPSGFVSVVRYYDSLSK
jgi:hypothetical protein